MEVAVALVLARPAGTAGAVVSGGGGVILLTVTVILVAVVVLPAASLATALRVWEPLDKVVVFQAVE
jgi:hypothetical protein